MGRQHQGMDRPGVREVPEGRGEKGKKWRKRYEIICGDSNDHRDQGIDDDDDNHDNDNDDDDDDDDDDDYISSIVSGMIERNVHGLAPTLLHFAYGLDVRRKKKKCGWKIIGMMQINVKRRA